MLELILGLKTKSWNFLFKGCDQEDMAFWSRKFRFWMTIQSDKTGKQENLFPLKKELK